MATDAEGFRDHFSGHAADVPAREVVDERAARVAGEHEIARARDGLVVREVVVGASVEIENLSVAIDERTPAKVVRLGESCHESSVVWTIGAVAPPGSEALPDDAFLAWSRRTRLPYKWRNL